MFLTENRGDIIANLIIEETVDLPTYLRHLQKRNGEEPVDAALSMHRWPILDWLIRVLTFRHCHVETATEKLYQAEFTMNFLQ